MSKYNQNKIISERSGSDNNNVRLLLYSTYWSTFEGGTSVNADQSVKDLQVSDAFLIKEGEEIKRVIKSVYISSN